MENLTKIAERLNEFKDEANLTAKALAKELGFSRVTVTNLLNGTHNPSTKFIIAFIDYFNCSADYVLCKTDFPKSDVFNRFTPIGKRLRNLLKESNMTETAFIDKLKISSSLSYRWLNDKALPNIDNLIVLSKTFSCSVDYLLGRES